MLIEALFECVACFPYILRVVAFFAIQNVDEIGCCASEFVSNVENFFCFLALECLAFHEMILADDTAGALAFVGAWVDIGRSRDHGGHQ